MEKLSNPSKTREIIEKYGFDFRKRFGQASPGSTQSRTLRQLTRPFLLRRLKSMFWSGL